ncbi:NAD(P)-dependent oxidoreductase [Arboricoccus pini]|nr:NAD(P)-dependent oxidoreductase [Arboricoccus pini]
MSEDGNSTFKVLVADLMALAPGADGQADPTPFRHYVETVGGRFHAGGYSDAVGLEPGRVHFFYRPELSREEDLLAEAGDGRYDAIIAAATVIPAGTRFAFGGVRIGAGTGNMRSESWGGGDGRGGTAALMNTPGMNSRATAQMVIKALLRRRPDLPFEALHDRVMRGEFDTGRDLGAYATTKLEGQTMAILGYGNIGREVARLAAAFGMKVRIHARARHRVWIESEGFAFAATPADALLDADVVSVHLGLGPVDPARNVPVNVGFVGEAMLERVAPGAMLINFDRGEVVDTPALERALASGRIGQLAVDADIFLDRGGKATGPLAPYLPLARRFGDRVLLLPHAVADTDHPTRLAGARLAVDLILDLLKNRRVHNLVGDLPAGFVDGGPARPRDIGSVSTAILASLGQEGAHLAEYASVITSFYGAAAGDRVQATTASFSEAVMAGNRLTAKLRDLGLLGPFQE